MIVSTEGDIGDIVILLGILKQIPNGPHTLLLKPSHGTKARPGSGAETMLRVMKPLAEAQSYISEMRMWTPNDREDWSSADFRRDDYQHGNTLFDAHLNHLIRTHGIGAGFTANEPWLEIPEVSVVPDRIVIARSGRHRNTSFPWAAVVHKYSYRLLFTGLHHEWREFCGHYGFVDYAPTENMLDVAKVIASSVLFIGNQSSPNAVAEGIKHNMIQEVALHAPDCIYQRTNAQHCYDGVCTLPAIGIGEDEVTIPDLRQRRNIHTAMTPPGMWQFPGCQKSIGYNQIHAQVKRLPEWAGKSDEDIRGAIIDCTLSRVPDWQNNAGDYSIVKTALFNAAHLFQPKKTQPSSDNRLIPHS